jgi:hypothetical protein
MKQKQLSEVPEYAAALERFQTLQNEQLKSREKQIEIDNECTKPELKRSITAALGAELEQLQKREPLLLEELEDARQELDRVRGKLSLELSQSARLEDLPDIQEILKAQEAIIAANNRIQARRDAREKAGISNCLPSAAFGVGAIWLDLDSFPLVAYRRQVRESYPELRL